jgi:4-coumarate--CoA ligase
MRAKIYSSPHPDIDIPDLTVTEWVFRGLDVAAETPIFVEAATGRDITGGAAKHAIQSLASGLVKRGLRPGAVVGIMAANGIDYFVALHAVLYAGGTITLINPSYTKGEIAHQLSTTDAQLLIVDAPLAGLAKEANPNIDILTFGAEIDAVKAAPLDAQVPLDPRKALAAIQFSSGTTGLPKGVMLSHRNLVANATIWVATRKLTCEDITPTFLPFFHIFGLTLMQMVYPGVGAQVHLMPRFDLEGFLELAQTSGAQRLWVVPPVAIALAKNSVVDAYDLSKITEVGSGAAPLSTEIGATIRKRLSCAFFQGYGMTEVGGIGTAHISGAAENDTLGAPIANCECRIVDPDTGEDSGVGELWMRGPVVMRGYLNNPEATAETLTQDGWLRTGDIGAFDADTQLTLSDRLKELIKVKGFQVAPAEVEAALITHPDIADVAVFGMPDDDAGEVPVGAIVPANGAKLTLQDVQAFLSDRLAKYKIIQRLEVREAIPKAASGKILRRVLRSEYL